MDQMTDKEFEESSKATLDNLKKKWDAAFKKYPNNKKKRIDRYFASIGM